MNERETTSFQTPVGNKNIVIKTYLTGREKRELTNVYLKGNLDFSVDTQNVKGLDYKLVDEAQNLAWKTVIVSVDGKKDGEIDLVNIILDMRSEDFDFVVSKVNEITTSKSFVEKKRHRVRV